MKRSTTTAGLVLAMVFLVSSASALEVSGTVNANIGAETEGSLDTQTKASATTSDSSDSNATLTTSGAVSVIVITRADVQIDADAAADVSPASVRSDADLSSYVAAQVAGDENVSKIETSAENVSVTYKQRAWLFGLVPVTLDVSAIVRTDGSVDVRYPWYAFLMVTNESELEATIEDRIATSAFLASNAEAQAEAGFTSQVQARLISEVRSVMAAELAADVAAEFSGEANANVE